MLSEEVQSLLTDYIERKKAKRAGKFQESEGIDFAKIQQYLEECETFEAPLSLKQKDFLKVMYGVPTTNLTSTDVPQPPDPEECIYKAQKYLEKQAKKGFINDKNPPQILNAYNRNRFFDQKKTKDGATQLDLASLYVKEPELQFWMNLDVVKNSAKEISNLPFLLEGDVGFAMSKLYELSSGAIRGILSLERHKNRSYNKSHPGKVIYLDMTDFISAVRKARFDIIKTQIERNKLDLDHLTPQQKKEFSEFLPHEEEESKEAILYSQTEQDQGENNSQNPSNLPNSKLSNRTNHILNFNFGKPKVKQLSAAEMNDNLLIRVSQNCTKLPPAYRITDIRTDDDALSKQKKSQKKFLSILLPQIKAAMEQTKEVKEELPQIIEEPKVEEKKVKRKGPYIIMSPVKPQNSVQNAPNVQEEEEQMELDDIKRCYWSQEDPLAVHRRKDAKIEPLDDFRSIVDNFHYYRFHYQDSDIEEPFPLESIRLEREKALKAEREAEEREEAERKRKEKREREDRELEESYKKAEGPTLIGAVWNTSDLTFGKSAPLNNSEYPMLNQTNTNLLANSRTNNVSKIFNGRMSSALQFLSSHQVSENPVSQAIHSKLDEIWGKLGFSVQQKFTLLLKYSKDTEESSKLKDALVHWEHCYQTWVLYDKAYKNIKDFCRYDVRSSKKPFQELSQLVIQIKMQEDVLDQSCRNLKKQFGDDFVVKRKKYQEVLSDRGDKIIEMIEPHHVKYEKFVFE